MAYKKSDFEDKLFSKFGFVWKKGKGRNPHERLALFHNGMQVASTGLSRGLKNNSDIGDDLLLLIAREIRVRTMKNIRGMIDCDIGLKDYLEILSSQGYL